MYFHNCLLPPQSSLFVTVNATNQYIATANIDGNISIRSLDSINNLYDSVGSVPIKINDTTITSNDVTKAIYNVNPTPEIDNEKILNSQKILHTVAVRSRSKITALRYANLSTNANLLAAIYKNGEVYIITNPQDPIKCRIQQIFKHVNGLLLDFSWSADDQLMSFASMNNEVIIYDVIYGKQIANIHPHTNTIVKNVKDGTSEELTTPIKGIMFDKTSNQCLYTLGDDKVLNVIKYKVVNDHILGRIFDYTITNEFNDVFSSSKLHKASLKKISTTSDDRLISIPNTSKSKSLKISLLSKNDENIWSKSNTVFTAFGLKCFSTAFSPCIYKNSKNELVYILATSSPDCGISIWRTDSTIPLYISLEFTSPSVLDICWSIDGTKIFFTRSNGSMLVAVFNKGEFGDPVYKDTELSSELLKKTKELLPVEFAKMTEWRKFIKDHPSLVEQKEEEYKQNELKKMKFKRIEIKPAERKEDSSTPAANNTTMITITANNDSNSDIKKLTKDDKVLNDVKKLPLLAPSSNKEENTKPSDESKDKAVESTQKSKDSKEKENKTSTQKTGAADKVKSEKDKKDNNNSTVGDKNKDKEKEKEKTKEKEKDKGSNKQKKQDKDISDSNGTTTNGSSEKQKENKSDKPEVNPKKRALPTSNYDSPSNCVSKDLNNKASKMMKKDSSNENTPANKKKKETESVEFVGSIIINPQLSFSNMRIATPRLRNNILFKVPDDETLILNIKNGNGLESNPTKVTLFKQTVPNENKQTFVDFIPHKIHTACGSTKFLAISTIDGQIITYSESGRRILPPIVLGNPLSFLEMKGKYLLAVTCTGELFVWDLVLKKSVFKPISLYPLLQPLYSSGQILSTNMSLNSTLDGNQNNQNSNINIEANGLIFVNGELLTKSENLTVCSITEQGIPVVTLTNGNGYLFNKDMNTWSLISDSWWAFGSQYADSSLSVDTLKDFGLLEYMESQTNDQINRRGKAKFFTKISKMMLMKEGYESLETVISLNHLENKIYFYMLLNDYINYKRFLITYTKRLSELNLKNRLLEVFNGLFIDLDGEICGYSKKKLLEELILSCSKHREVQHILVQYSESIGLLTRDDDSDIDIV